MYAVIIADLNSSDRADRIPALTAAERQARSRDARTQAGGKQISVMLTPKAWASLRASNAKGIATATVINRLLEG